MSSACKSPGFNKQLITWARSAVLSLIALLISSQCLASTEVTLQLKWRHQFQFAGYYAAKMQGYFKEQGLEVNFKEVALGETAVNAVTSGQAEYGIADSSLVCRG